MPVADRRPRDRGAAAVEAAIVLGFIAIPLLLGVISYGQYFWQAQRVQTQAVRLPQGAVIGVFPTCQALAQTVRETLLAIAVDLDGTLPTTVTEDTITVVVQMIEGVEVGADVSLSIDVPLVGALGSLIPLPGGGATTIDLQQRLSDVVVDSNELDCRLEPGEVVT